MTNEEWLEANANIKPNRNNISKAYFSKVDGSYITRVGMERNIEHLVDRGLTQVQNTRGLSENSANIGFNEEEQKWYGWSHRAFYGFGIGSEVAKGDCAYKPTDKDDFLDDMVLFWIDKDHLNVTGEHTDEGVKVSWDYSDTIPNEKLRGTISGCTTGYPKRYGRGEWVAENLTDARRMACDFAEGVS